MHRKLFISAILSFCLTFNAQAAPPSVAVDIAPLHSLVSQVMEGVGKPALLIPVEASPHQYNLRPSQARALSNAKVVFWMSEILTPWLSKAMDNVANSAQKIEMLNLAGTTTHSFREGARFESHSEHATQKGHHDDAHEVHANKSHHAGHDHHGKGPHANKSHHAGHDHHGKDPHAWLDPQNAKLWVNVISKTLSQQDPANAALYRRNAAKTQASLDMLMRTTSQKIRDLGQPRFVVFHDAYQYFEQRFNILAVGAISLGDAEDPSPARIKAVQETVKKLGITCVFTEPQYNSGLVKNVFEDTNIAMVGVMDPLGVGISAGSRHYQAVIEAIADSLSQCK